MCSHWCLCLNFLFLFFHLASYSCSWVCIVSLLLTGQPVMEQMLCLNVHYKAPTLSLWICMWINKCIQSSGFVKSASDSILCQDLSGLSWTWLLLLSRFSRVRLCATPETAAHQAPPSLRFSRQEHWSGLPFPSPMHKSEKWKWSRSVVSDS